MPPNALIASPKTGSCVKKFTAVGIRLARRAHHLKEQMGAPARGMHLFARDSIARTHGAAAISPAFANADATQSRVRKAALVPSSKRTSPCTRLRNSTASSRALTPDELNLPVAVC